MSQEVTPPEPYSPRPRPAKGQKKVPLVLGGLVAAVLLVGGALYHHAMSSTNQVALASSPKGVTTLEAKGTTYRPTRRYVGTVEPWVEAKIGPQLVSAYVDTVLVRPGAVVKRGDVIATLDCRNASAADKAVQMQARALEATQAAAASEAARVSSLLDGGFVSPNEVEKKKAESDSKAAQMMALKAQMMGNAVQIGDCVLRAPFDGEVAFRHVDPGAFVKPGVAIATLVDRRTVRVTADVPEDDFAAVAPGTEVTLRYLATGQTATAKISRRAPAADPSTRTAHIEIDVEDPERTLPVGTTAELGIDVGEPQPATEIPLAAASVRGSKASLFVIEGGVAHQMTAKLLGELAGHLFLDPALKAGSHVVTEGRTALANNDRVVEKLDHELNAPPAGATQVASPREGHLPVRGAVQ